jgi:hypothetical protein
MCCIYNGEVENIELAKIMRDISVILGLKTLTNYAKSENISYPAAAKRKTERLKIDKVEFIIDNE